MASLTAEQLIQFIAHDRWELSHDNVIGAYRDYKLGCQDWLNKNCVERGTNVPFHDEF